MKEGQTQACESRMDPQITGDIFRLGLGRDSLGTQMLLLTELASDWHKRSYRRWSHQPRLPHFSWCPCPLLCDFATSPSHTHIYTHTHMHMPWAVGCEQNVHEQATASAIGTFSGASASAMDECAPDHPLVQGGQASGAGTTRPRLGTARLPGAWSQRMQECAKHGGLLWPAPGLFHSR